MGIRFTFIATEAVITISDAFPPLLLLEVFGSFEAHNASPSSIPLMRTQMRRPTSDSDSFPPPKHIVRQRIRRNGPV